MPERPDHAYASADHADASEMRVLVWNLFHGRAAPSAGRPLQDRFTELISGWRWDVALLQEVPPWWAPALARATGAHQRAVLTSRNALLPLRRAVADRWPDLVKSNGGGANAILSRTPIAEHRALRLRWWPERRVGQLARLGAGGLCLANVHASARVPLAREELRRLWSEASAWSAGAPLLLGGDLNLRDPSLPTGGAAQVAHLARRDVDHVFGRGLLLTGEVEMPDRSVMLDGREVVLSDHPALIVPVKAVGVAPSADRRRTGSAR